MPYHSDQNNNLAKMCETRASDPIYYLTSAVNFCVDKHRKKYEKLCKS